MITCPECKYYKVLLYSTYCDILNVFDLPVGFGCLAGKPHEDKEMKMDKADELFDPRDDPRPMPEPSLVLPEPKSEPTSTEEIEEKLLRLAQEANDLSLDINNLELQAEIVRRQRADLERQAKVLSGELSQLRGRMSAMVSQRAYYTLKLDASEGRN